MSTDNDNGALVRDAVALAIVGPAKVSAIKAIKTLVFGTADYASAWFERWSAEVRAGTTARLAVSDAMARAAVAHVGADDDLAERAVQAWLPQAIRNQRNRESIAREFLDELGSKKLVSLPGGEVSDDWIERYAEYAGKISEEDLQTVLARILVREVCSPGTVPISTLRIIAELDSDIATAFQRHADHVFEGKWIFYTNAFADEPLFEEMLNLAAAGLVAYPDTSTVEEFKVTAGEPYMLDCGEHGLSLAVKETQILRIRSIPLTRAGRQVYGALNISINEKTARSVADHLVPLVNKSELHLRIGQSWVYSKTISEVIDDAKSTEQ